MKVFSRHIYKYLTVTLLTLSACIGALSLFMDTHRLNPGMVASHTSDRLAQDFDKLDARARVLMEAPLSPAGWPEIEPLPRHMVLYRYDNDTISCWFNQFPVRAENIAKVALYPCMANPKANLNSPLATVGEAPRYVNLDRQWYVIRSISSGRTTVVEGLLVKDDTRENISSGRTGVNPILGIPSQFDVSTLVGGEGAAVTLDGEPLFNIIISNEESSDSISLPAAMLRWLAIVLFALASICFLAGHRSQLSCALVCSLIAVLAILSRFWESFLSSVSTFFSPLAFANDGLMDSFASLLIFNTAIFMMSLCLYICRRESAVAIAPSRPKSVVSYIALGITAALDMAYIIFSYKSLLSNSGMAMERFYSESFPWLSTLSYISFSILCTSVLLIGECAAALYNERRRKAVSVLGFGPSLLYSFAMAMVLTIMLVNYGFEKEQDRVAGWSNRIALDRDLRMEMNLRVLEADIAMDPVIRSMVEAGGHDNLISDRLENMYLGRISQNYNVSVSTVRGISLPQYLAIVLPLGHPVSEDSHFLYSYDEKRGSCYNYALRYGTSDSNVSALIVHLEPRRDAGVEIPPVYSYAKYSDKRLVSFSGNYPYPTLLTSRTVDPYNTPTFKMKGYRHFVNVVNADEVIVISRPVRGVLDYFVTFTAMAILIFVIILILRPGKRGLQKDGMRYFSRRMRTLTVTSLIIALLTMTGVSVFFVYQRNDRTVRKLMTSEITSLQLFMDDICRDVESADQLMNAEFVRQLEEFARNRETQISLYTPSGALFYSREDQRLRPEKTSLRVDDRAYRSIMFDHQRFYMSSARGLGRRNHVIYAPVFNSDGRLLCIVSIPYMYLNYDLMRDTLMHTATILSLFFILLLFTIFFTKHISHAIFSPLTSITQKMKSVSAEQLEEVEYDGDDEISFLVKAYNNMVVGLRSSTRQLAAAERDRAWSAMARQVTHEIKNPLTPIKLNIQRLIRLKQKGDPSWQTKFDQVAQVLLENIDILTETADEFGTYAKLSSEDPVEINLDSMLQDQMLLFGESGVDITYLGMPEAVMMGPRPQLSRVFVNLITNAVQALAGVENPTVIVSLRRSGDGFWDVAIEDNGAGVPEENRERLFTPNFTTKSSGTGLGLAISRSVVESMGGTITYSRSFALGGACFTVHLPAKKSA